MSLGSPPIGTTIKPSSEHVMEFAKLLWDNQQHCVQYEKVATSDVDIGRPQPVPFDVLEASGAWHLVKCGLVPYTIHRGDIQGFKFLER